MASACSRSAGRIAILLLPVNHTLLSTENAKNRLREVSPKIDARFNGGKQRKLAQQTVVAKTTKMCIKGVFSLI